MKKSVLLSLFLSLLLVFSFSHGSIASDSHPQNEQIETLQSEIQSLKRENVLLKRQVDRLVMEKFLIRAKILEEGHDERRTEAHVYQPPSPFVEKKKEVRSVFYSFLENKWMRHILKTNDFKEIMHVPVQLTHYTKRFFSPYSALFYRSNASPYLKWFTFFFIGAVIVFLSSLIWLLLLHKEEKSLSGHKDSDSSEGDFPDEDSSGDYLDDVNSTMSKLDLARAYIDMGDQHSAKEILEEVVEKGEDAERNTALSLLQKLSDSTHRT